jgi:CBS domain-containing protein
MADRTAVDGDWAASAPVHRSMRPIVWAEAGTTIGEAARLLDGDDHSCVLARLSAGLGIATDHDFRRSLTDDSLGREAPVATICSTPVVTVAENSEASTAFLEMIERGIHHLVVTTDLGDPVGVVRVVDLASAEVRDPLFVRRAVQRATTLAELREACSTLPLTAVELTEIGTPPLQVAGLLSAVRDVVVRRAVELTPTDDSAAEPSWLVLGSLARREALPGSDVDTAMVWPTSSDDRADELRAHAEAVLTAVEQCGLARCPDGANATEPLFARSVDGWSEATARWTRSPDSSGAMLLTSIVADNRPLTHVDLGRAVTESMLGSVRNATFLDALLHFTLAVKPHRRLARRGGLDLKHGGLWPVVLLGRWLGLVVGDAQGSTVDRIRRGSAAGLLTRGEADDLIAAFELIFRLRFERAIAALDSGDVDDSHVGVRALDPLQRRYLNDSLRAIAAIQTGVRKSWGAARSAFG